MTTNRTEQLLDLGRSLLTQVQKITLNVESGVFPASKALVVLDKQISIVRACLETRTDLAPIMDVVVENLDAARKRIDAVYKKAN